MISQQVQYLSAVPLFQIALYALTFAPFTDILKVGTVCKSPAEQHQEAFWQFCLSVHRRTLLPRMYLQHLPEPMTLLSFWRKAKCTAHRSPNLQSLLQHKDILVHPPLYTNFACGVGEDMVPRKNRKAGFLLDFAHRQEHADAHLSGRKVSKQGKHYSEQAVSQGVSLWHFPGTQSVWDQSKAEVHNGGSAAVTSYILLQLLSHPSVWVPSVRAR